MATGVPCGAVELGQADSGGRRSVRVSEDVLVALPENPTTGYRWYPDVDEAALQIVDDRNEVPGPRRGAPGIRCLTFRPVRTGSTRLRLERKRPWEDVAVEEFVVDLDVSG